MSSAARTSTRRPAAPTAREVAALVLSRVESEQAFANVLLYHHLADAKLGAADAGLATELVYGTLRQQSRVDWTLAGAARYPLAEIPPRIRAILREGAYQLLFLHRIPARAVVHEAVRLARRHGHAGTAGLVNAVLRRIAAQGERPIPPDGDPAARLALAESHPSWLVDRWVERFGIDETLALCRANNAPAPVYARVNRLRADPATVVQDLAAAGVAAQPTWLPEGLRLDGPFGGRHHLVVSGVLTMQDLGAMVVTHLLDPQPGETIIDACAAPGGKSTHIAERIGDRGRVIACDVHPGKLDALRRRVAVMGLHCVEVVQHDARTPFRLAADRVLVDAPCTGLGVVRRRPEIKWRIHPGDVAALAARQHAILQGAADAVRSGGMLLYSVCSTEPEEGPMVVEQFLRARPDFVLDANLSVPAACSASAGSVLLLPHRHDTDGFFIARMRRRAETET